MKILFLAPYPQNKAPSQRFRFEFFLKSLKTEKIDYDFQSFLSENGWKHSYVKGAVGMKVWALVSGYLRRIFCLFKIFRYEVIFIHRELTPFGPPIFAWIIAKVFKKKIIYDFDDAIWMADPNGESGLWKTLKWRGKVAAICQWSRKVSAGNQYLADYASQYCDRVVVFPTVVNTNIHRPKNDQSNFLKKKLVIGWTGSHSTLVYLDPLIPVLKKLEQVHAFDFLVIANKNPVLPLQGFYFLPWQEKTEIEDLSQMDIGIMPLADNEWSKGKCGFKLIQYGALGIPSVTSPVGVNTDIIQDGVNGYLASTDTEWIEKLSLLIQSEDLRKQLGKAGRKTVEDQYSVEANKEKWISLFR
jgi:glycosyltransferase involved in cell wall biosynthesis